MTVLISSAVHAELLAAAAESPTREICGLLVGEGSITVAIAADNVAPNPRDSFEIDPTILFAAIRAERDGGPRLIGYYHSHPRGGPTPSMRDRTHAVADGRVWIIIGEETLRAWRMGSDGQFTSDELLVI